MGADPSFNYLCAMQTLLVIITFLLAVGFLLKKFVWNPIYETRKPGGKKGDHSDCGSCSLH